METASRLISEYFISRKGGTCVMSIVIEDLVQIFEGLKEKRKHFDNSTVLLTGCAGFLGYYFMMFFDRYGDDLNVSKVIGLDNFMLGKPRWIDELDQKRFEIYQFDIISDYIADIKGAENANYIIHMASIASPVFYRQYPIETLDANIWGLRNLLEFYKRKDVSGFLFFSSSEIYGDPTIDHVPTNEEYRGLVSVTGPRACYDEAKRFGETICMLFAQQYNMPIGVARPFNNYGPGMRLNDQRVPADFAKAVCSGQDIRILSNGAPTRTFCYVSDAICGYLKILLHGKYDYFNIGMNVPEISINQLANLYVEIAKEIFGYDKKIVYEISNDKEYLSTNPQRRCPDISKAQRILGYNPTIKIDEGIFRFLKHIAENNMEDLQW